MISRLLFESFWVLLGFAAVGQIGLVLIWRWRQTRESGRRVGVGFAASAVLLTLSHLVITPRERIIGLCRDLATMVEHVDVAGIGRHLSDDFEAGGFGRDEFLDRARTSLTRFPVHHARLRGFEIEFPKPERAVAVFNAVCRVRRPDLMTDWLVTRWRVTLQNNGDEWLVRHVEAIPTPFSPIRNVRDYLR